MKQGAFECAGIRATAPCRNDSEIMHLNDDPGEKTRIDVNSVGRIVAMTIAQARALWLVEGLAL